MKNIFKLLSGRPKDGDVIECIRPIIVLPQFMITILLMTWGIRFRNPLIGIMALIFAWQIGWGMSIERFNKNKNNS